MRIYFIDKICHVRKIPYLEIGLLSGWYGCDDHHDQNQCLKKMASLLVTHAESHGPQREAKAEMKMIWEPGSRHWCRGYGREWLVDFLLFAFSVCLNIKSRTSSLRISVTKICRALQHRSIIKKISYRLAPYSLVCWRLFFPNWLPSSQVFLFHITLTEN